MEFSTVQIQNTKQEWVRKINIKRFQVGEGLLASVEKSFERLEVLFSTKQKDNINYLCNNEKLLDMF